MLRCYYKTSNVSIYYHYKKFEVLCKITSSTQNSYNVKINCFKLFIKVVPESDRGEMSKTKISKD